MDFRPDISAALLQVTREINEPRELQSTLDMIVETAARSLPGIDHVGITIASRDGDMETRAGSDPFVWELDRLQYGLGEGPCVHAIGVDPVTTVEWASREQRWPRFMPLALAKGLRAQMGMRLYTERETLGGLNMYSTSSDTIDTDVVHMAELFAAHASLALGHARREEQLSATGWTRTARSPISPGSHPTATSSCARSPRRSSTCATTPRRSPRPSSGRRARHPRGQLVPLRVRRASPEMPYPNRSERDLTRCCDLAESR